MLIQFIKSRQCQRTWEISKYLRIEADLSFSMAVGGRILKNASVGHITSDRIQRLSDVANILAWLDTLAIPNQNSHEKVKLLTESFVEHMNCFEVTEEVSRKMSFLMEQLQLAVGSKKNYSKDLLVLSMVWKATSTSLYKAILSDGILSLPSIRTLRRLSEPIRVCTGSTESNTKYLEARVFKLTEKQRIVTLMADEIHLSRRVEYVSGKFYGLKDDNLAHTMLCFMVKSMSCNYKDVVSMYPIHKLDAGSQMKAFMSTMEMLQKIGFKVLALSLDNYSVNRKMYTDMCNGTLTSQIANPTADGKPLFLLFDQVHNFKNIYNNFLKQEKFILPGFDDGEQFEASYDVVRQLYDLETGKPARLAHKLSDKVLQPKVLEKTNVSLSESFFHESTIQALSHVNIQGSAGTAKFMEFIREGWNICNVKRPHVGTRKCDQTRMPINNEECDALTYLEMFCDWLVTWEKWCKKPGFKKWANQGDIQSIHSNYRWFNTPCQISHS